jgi:hypothetical protein
VWMQIACSLSIVVRLDIPRSSSVYLTRSPHNPTRILSSRADDIPSSEDQSPDAVVGCVCGYRTVPYRVLIIVPVVHRSSYLSFALGAARTRGWGSRLEGHSSSRVEIFSRFLLCRSLGIHHVVFMAHFYPPLMSHVHSVLTRSIGSHPSGSLTKGASEELPHPGEPLCTGLVRAHEPVQVLGYPIIESGRYPLECGR